jgi:hypothetical protein
MGTWLPPVEMPPQTYQWNLRGVVDAPAEPTDPAAPPQQGAATAPAPPGVASPPSPSHLSPPPAGHPGYWQPPAGASPTRADRSYGGLTAACIVALVLPVGLAFGLEGLAWHHRGTVNWVLVATVASVAVLGSILIGLLASELGRQRSVLRGLAAAGLSSVTSLLLALLIDDHPGKFGFHLSTSALIALVGPLLAFAVAWGRSDRG